MALWAHLPTRPGRRGAPWAVPQNGRWGRVGSRGRLGWRCRRHGAQRPRYALQAADDRAKAKAGQGEPPLRRGGVRCRELLQHVPDER